jgi:hypothetical protein
MARDISEELLRLRLAFNRRVLEEAGFVAIKIVGGIIQADSRCGQSAPPKMAAIVPREYESTVTAGNPFLLRKK